MGIQLSDLVENVVGIEEIARYEQFLLFQQRFQKLLLMCQNEYICSKGLILKGYFSLTDCHMFFCFFFKINVFKL